MGKKNRKQKAEEPDWMDEMDELRAEMGIEPKKELKAEPVRGKKEKTRKGRKADPDSDDDGDSADSDADSDDAPTAKAKSAPKGFAGLTIDDDSDEDDDSDDAQSNEAEATTKGAAPAAAGGDDDDADDTDDAAADEATPAVTVKTAAQKRAEKKEREKAKKEAERAKKAAQRAKAKAKREAELKELENLLESTSTDPQPAAATESKTASADPPAESTPTPQPDTPQTPETPATPADGGDDDDDDAAEGEGDGEGSSKKKKKKKKKKAAAATVAEQKSAPKMSKAKQLLLQKQKEQHELEERIKREEEERKRQEEEELKRIEEEERLAEEARQRKKEKEKEKRERLRAEGKLLTTKQKQQKALAEQKLAQMRAMGMEVPATGEDAAPKKPVKYEKKKRSKKGQPGAQSGEAVAKPEATPAAEKAEKAEAVPEPEPKPEPKPEPAPVVADAWDAWDKSSDEEEEAAKDAEGDKADKPDAEPEAAASGDAEADAKAKQEAEKRIQSRREQAEKKRSQEQLRSPIVAVLGHVDTGKTKLLDKIRRGNVQEGEAGGITQQIGATYFPKEEIVKQTAKVDKQNSTRKSKKAAGNLDVNVPGLLIIDTPGHESFSNLRSRGSSLCDIAILVVDIMHGLEPQTIESIELLRSKKTPFVVALNKIDRCNEWNPNPNAAVLSTLAKQKPHTKSDFEERATMVKTQFAERGINAALYWENPDERSYVNVVPTSAITGEGVPDLLYLIISLTQKRLAHRIAFSEELEATVLEVKVVPGLGTTIDIILAQGSLREGETIVLCGLDGPIVTTIRSLLMPQPMKELRVKNAYVHFKEISAANGIKIAADGLAKAVAGTPLLVAKSQDEVECLMEEQEERLEATLSAIHTEQQGVSVQASTLGSLEALLEFLKQSKIPVSTINIGPIHKKDVTKTSIQLEKDRKYAVILAFDVPTDRDAQAMADDLGIRIFTADIIYHLFDAFTQYLEDLKAELREKFKNIATFPCRMKLLPDCVFNARDPIVVGVRVEAGILKPGAPICVGTKQNVLLGRVSTLEFDNNAVESAKKGQEVCIKIEATGGEKKAFGRHFDADDVLITKISRESIDACKKYFRDDLSKEDWKLMVQLKKHFNIL